MYEARQGSLGIADLDTASWSTIDEPQTKAIEPLTVSMV
jgi:hypothetical protein